MKKKKSLVALLNKNWWRPRRFRAFDYKPYTTVMEWAIWKKPHPRDTINDYVKVRITIEEL